MHFLVSTFFHSQRIFCIDHFFLLQVVAPTKIENPVITGLKNVSLEATGEHLDAPTQEAIWPVIVSFSRSRRHRISSAPLLRGWSVWYNDYRWDEELVQGRGESFTDGKDASKVQIIIHIVVLFSVYFCCHFSTIVNLSLEQESGKWTLPFFALCDGADVDGTVLVGTFVEPMWFSTMKVRIRGIVGYSKIHNCSLLMLEHCKLSKVPEREVHISFIVE